MPSVWRAFFMLIFQDGLIPVVMIMASAPAAFPVITILGVMTIADNCLVVPSFKGSIFFSVNIVMHPWGAVVYYNLIAMINIIIAITWWQRS